MHPIIQKAINAASSSGRHGSQIVVLPIADGNVQLVLVSLQPISRNIDVNHHQLPPAMARRIAGLLLAAANVAEGTGTAADLVALDLPETPC